MVKKEDPKKLKKTDKDIKKNQNKKKDKKNVCEFC